MHPRVGKAVSAAAALACAWYVLHLVRLALQLFYPATHVPLLKPLPPEATAAGLRTSRLAWQEPFDFTASMYVLQQPNFLAADFFNASTRVWQTDARSLAYSRHMRLEDHVPVNAPADAEPLYAFLFVQSTDREENGHPDLHDPLVAYARALLVTMREQQVDLKRSLVDRSAAHEGETGSAQEGGLVPHIKTRLHWEIVLEDVRFGQRTMPADLAPYLRMQRGRAYVPLVWENPLAARAEHWTPLAQETPPQVDVSLRGIGLGWFRLCNYAHHGLAELRSERALVQYSESDVDNLREMVYEVNPLMLVITMVAMALHALFEFLAYKEDVSFWSARSEASLRGVSRSSMAMTLASSWISLLYLCDRRSETNIVVLVGAAAGAAVEAWKFSRVVRLRDLLWWRRSLDQSAVASAASGTISERERVQRQVDRQTAWYMGRVCLPLMAAYAAGSLVYQKHESYVSWLLNTSLVTVYSLEFVQMWPQLLINHRLKSVDMLPLTAFLYRFLLTFIDDLYALVVPMPLIERIGTLRDDVVFVVLCYQWFTFPRRKTKNEDKEEAPQEAQDETTNEKTNETTPKKPANKRKPKPRRTPTKKKAE
ncbi:Cleft lip and palate associated transmembrane protein 1 [Coemansia sp. RSA 552]|nr:Cleft lip and palate associated transmembrane protein 1 [Coemansia sp. RSA 552]